MEKKMEDSNCPTPHNFWYGYPLDSLELKSFFCLLFLLGNNSWDVCWWGEMEVVLAQTQSLQERKNTYRGVHKAFK